MNDEDQKGIGKSFNILIHTTDMHSGTSSVGRLCDLPSGSKPEGSIIYNADYEVFQGCEGTTWIALKSLKQTGSIPGLQCPDITDPIAHWAFDESAGTTATDIAGSNVGTVTGATWQPSDGRIAGALQFDGIDDRVVISDFAYGAASTDYAVSFWFKPIDNSGTAFQYIYSHGTVDSANSINVYCVESGGATNPNALYVSWRDSGGIIAVSHIIPDACVENEWHFISLNKGVNKNFWFVNFNGGVRSTGYNSSSTVIFNPAGDIFIGGRNDLSATRFFNGLVDDIRIYEPQITPGENNSLYFGADICE